MINIDMPTRTLINNIKLPFSIKFNFIDEYPYELKKVEVHNYMRIDQLARQISGDEAGWKLICIFNSIINPLEIKDKDYVYIPADFNRAINWLTQKI